MRSPQICRVFRLALLPKRSSGTKRGHDFRVASCLIVVVRSANQRLLVGNTPEQRKLWTEFLNRRVIEELDVAKMACPVLREGEAARLLPSRVAGVNVIHGKTARREPRPPVPPSPSAVTLNFSLIRPGNFTRSSHGHAIRRLSRTCRGALLITKPYVREPTLPFLTAAQRFAAPS